MTHKVDLGCGVKMLVIEPQSDGICQECGKKEETRPYGKGGKEVCFDCGMKDEACTKAHFESFVTGEPVPEEFK